MATEMKSRLIAGCDLCGASETDPKGWQRVIVAARPLEDPSLADAKFAFDVCEECVRDVGLVRRSENKITYSLRGAWAALKRRLATWKP